MALTKELLHDLFEYKDGELFWKNPKSRRLRSGDKAGGIGGKGYIFVRINWKRYNIHSIIYMMHHGHIPQILDHIDGDITNNRIENLRPATSAQNCCNRGSQSNNTSGAKNVSWSKQRKKWIVMLRKNKVVKYIGGYEDFELAELVAMEARNKFHGQFANHGGAA